MAKDLKLSVLLSAVDKATGPLKKINNASGHTAKALKSSRGELKNLSTAQKKLGQFKTLRRGSEETAKQLKKQEGEVAALSRQIKTASGSTKRLNAKRNTAIKRAKKLSRQYEGEQKQLRTLRRDIDKTAGAGGTLADKEARLAKQVKRTNSRIERQQTALKRLGKARLGQRFGNMTNQVRRFGRRATMAFGVAAAGIYGLANSTADLGDDLQHQADQFGVTTQQIQKWHYAAAQARVSNEKFDSSLQRFVKRLGKAAKGSGAAKKAYEQLGLNAEKLAKMDTATAFDKVADALAKVDSKTQQVALASDLYGRSGVKLVNMLRDGSAGLREMGKAAEATGNVLSDKSIKASAEFAAAQIDVQQALGGVKNTIGAVLLPAITDLTKKLTGWLTENHDKVVGFAKQLGENIKAAVPAITNFAKGVANVTAHIGHWVNVLADAVGGFGNLGKILAAVFAAKMIASIVSFGAGIFQAGSAIVALAGGLPAVAAGIKAITVAMAANPIGLIITGIATAAFLIYKYWDPIRQFFSDLWGKIKGIFDGGIGNIAKSLVNWSPMGILYSLFQKALASLGVELPKQFSHLGSAVVHGLIGGIKNMAGALKDSVVNMGSSVTGWFKDKLGIHSPSRVFENFGMNTVEGYRRGLAGHENTAVKQVGQLTKRLRMAGAGVALGAAAMPAFAAATPTDHRPPIAAGTSSQSQTVNLGGITINAAPGMDEQALAQYVAAEVQRALARANVDAAAARRSALYDTE